MRIEKVASKRGQRVLAHFAEREQLKATEGGLIENYFQEGTGIKKDTQEQKEKHSLITLL
ncbi:MAG: hypothetical protein IJD12_08120 [Tidjanibacter sp.]|nr:hypothetical protein [Tidjanibacter sp.]MBR1958424.1 hypothetical protein [Tidjanibacter sp.]MBR3931087.1 hypothetical protein [Tidjanibacter sp.]